MSMISKHMLKPLAAAALLGIAGASNAAITVYTTLTSFNAAVGITGTDTFAGLSVTGPTTGPLTRSAGAYAYTATVGAASSDFWGSGSIADPSLSTNTATDSIFLSGFSAGVVAAGGNFFSTDVNGSAAVGGVILTAVDFSGASTQLIPVSTSTSFLGFVSNGALVSLTLSAIQTNFLVNPSFASADNLVLASVVPEPEAYALLLAGLGVVGFVARRRRS